MFGLTTTAKLEAEKARANRIAGKLLTARIALRDIEEMATPNCAHIGKKMAARARDAANGASAQAAVS